MDINTLKKSIAELTRGLQYSSESDFPIELLDWGHKSAAAIQTAISGEHIGCTATSSSATDFFNHYIQSREMSGDPTMIADAARYKKLQDFLVKNISSVTVWRCGKIRIDIYIVITAGDGHILALKTTAIET